MEQRDICAGMRFCTHTMWNSKDSDEFVLERVDTYDRIQSSVLSQDTAPFIGQGNRTIWTLSPDEGNPHHLDVVFNLRKWDTPSVVIIRVIANWINERKASSSVTAISYDGTTSVSYRSRILNNHELALHLELTSSPGGNTTIPPFDTSFHISQEDDGSGSGSGSDENDW